MGKLYVIISWTTIISALGLIFLVGYWLLFPYRTIVFNNIPFPLEKNTYKVGETIGYVVDACKYVEELPSVTKYFVDGVVYVTPDIPGVIPMGCHKTKIYVNVPQTLMPNTYVVKIAATFHPNPIRTITVTSFTQQVIITE